MDEAQAEGLWLNCGPVLAIKATKVKVGSTPLVEIQTASHSVHIWMADHDLWRQGGLGEMRYSQGPSLVWLTHRNSSPRTYRAPRKRQCQMVSGEWRRLLASQWFEKVGLWAGLMGTEAFQFAMERKAAELGLVDNFVTRGRSR